MANLDQAAKQEMIDRAYSLAFKYEAEYWACSQCALRAIQEVFGLVSDDLIKAAYCLAGGGGATGQGTCGALAAAMLAVGARYGREKAEMGQGVPWQPFALAKRVFDRFVAEYGSPICGDVVEKIFGRRFDYYSQEDMEAMEAAGAHRDKCPSVAANAARFAARVLLEAEEEGEVREPSGGICTVCARAGDPA